MVKNKYIVHILFKKYFFTRLETVGSLRHVNNYLL